ncbi:MAG: transcription antitermination factor NusB [Verrucomicrobiota bacterium]|jgi:N utilization substance protein B
MPSRRQIREAAVQFLYSADLEAGASPLDLREPFWQFLTESERRNLSIATFRTVQHLAHGREARLAEFVERSEHAKTEWTSQPSTEPLISDLNRLLALESSWSLAFQKLEKMPKAGEDDRIANELDDALLHFFDIDRDLAFHRLQFLKATEDLPQWKAKLEPLNASIRRLQRISDRVRMAESPENFPDQSDLSKIRQSRAELVELRKQTDTLVDAVLHAKKEIDQKLCATVENYAPERIDPVDRAVLRLGVYELINTDIPTKVVINEAIELAKRYGTSDSKRFVNGMLDAIAKARVP